MAKFGPLAAEICWRVWGTPANFNGFPVLAALLHGILVVGVSQTLRRWKEGATYIRGAAITLGIGPRFQFKSILSDDQLFMKNFCMVLSCLFLVTVVVRCA